MERGAESLFVPGELVQDYIAQGWVVIEEQVTGENAEVKQLPGANVVVPAPEATRRKRAGKTAG